MKNLILIFFILTNICYSQDIKENIVGDWNGIDIDGNKEKMIFSNDNYVSMTINGEFIDGKNYVIKRGKNNGQKGFIKYEIDNTSLPAKIDIIVLTLENNQETEKGRILGILNFINENEMKINLNFGGFRESEFNDSNKENTITLKRKE